MLLTFLQWALEMRLLLHELCGDVGSRGFCTLLMIFFSSLSHGGGREENKAAGNHSEKAF